MIQQKFGFMLKVQRCSNVWTQWGKLPESDFHWSTAALTDFEGLNFAIKIIHNKIFDFGIIKVTDCTLKEKWKVFIQWSQENLSPTSKTQSQWEGRQKALSFCKKSRCKLRN